ncbi:MAG TPA: xanthine dehydrogenase family protein subunit M [Xanthobacteraceae bacterium]|nr:xanthine dehydrogenase family protein subunit M [Xanthobacteraceae bacterium]
MKLPPFEYRCPQTLPEAIALLAANPGSARPLAGGQTLLPILAFRLADPTLLVDLRRVPDLDRITTDDEHIRIGAMVCWRQIEESAELRAACPILPEAISHVAHYQIRNRGTVGGSLAHADPAAEMPGLAVTCDAEIEIAGPSGSRTLPARSFFVAPLTTALEADELIIAVRIPRWPRHRRWAFEEFAMRRGDFALAAIALFYDQDASGRITGAHVGVIGATDIPRRLAQAEAALDGRILDEDVIAAAASAASAEVDPPSDIHAGTDYRRALVAALVERTLRRAAAA